MWTLTLALACQQNIAIQTRPTHPAPTAPESTPALPAPTGPEPTGPEPQTTPTTVPSAPVPIEQRVIYLAMPDRFRNGDPSNDDLGVPDCFDPANPSRHHGGDWRGLTDELDYLTELGVDALWITPPYQQTAPTSTSCGYHGYWGDFTDPDDGAVEPKFGTEDELQALADGLHARDMLFVLDLVANHPGRQARIAFEHPEWFHDAADCAASDEPDVDCSLNGLPDFDQAMPEVDAYLRAQSQGWVTRARADAVRLDTAKHLPAEWIGQSFVPALNADLAPTDPQRFVIGEIFDDSGYGRIEDYIDAGLPSAFDFPLRKALVDSVAHGGSIDLVASRVAEAVDRFGIEQANRMVHLLDNHDVQRFTEDVLHRPDEEATSRYRVGLAVLMTAPGIPQLTWGDELGMRGGPDPDNRRDMPDWAFDPSQRTGDPDGFLPDVGGTFETTRSLIALRRAHDALSIGSYAEMWRHNNSGAMVWAFFRSSGEDRVIVAVHMGTRASGPMSIKVQENPNISDADKAAMPDGVELAPVMVVGGDASGLGEARIEGGRLAIDDIPPLTVAVWEVGG